MSREIRYGPHNLYKGKYFIVFYDKTDRYFINMFDNVREILAYINKPITRQNINLLNVELYRALRTDTHFTKILTGEVMRVYIIDSSEVEEDDEEDF